MFHSPHQSGFTLIEALVAITVLVVGVLGPLVIAARGISDGLFARNQLAANYLAQEAIDLVVNRRDSNILNRQFGVDWFDGILGIDACLSGAPCQVNSQTGQISAGGPVALIYCRSTNFYEEEANCNPADQFGPIFNRSILIQTVTAANNPEANPWEVCEVLDPPEIGEPLEIRVTATVDWLNKTVPRSFVAVDNLYACE